MKKLNVHEAKTQLAAVLADVETKGETFLICRNGKPIADLVPHAKANRLTPHPVLRNKRWPSRQRPRRHRCHHLRVAPAHNRRRR